MLTMQKRLALAAVLLTLTAALAFVALREGSLAAKTGEPAAAAGRLAAAPVPAPAVGEPTREAVTVPGTVVADPAGAHVQLRFVRPEGGHLPAAEARRRFDSASAPCRVELVLQDVLGESGLRGVLKTLLGPVTVWRRDIEVTWNDDGAGFEAPAELRNLRVFVQRPDAEPFLGDVLTVAPGARLVVDVPLPSPRLRTVRLVAAESATPLANAGVQPFSELGDDSAFFAGSPRTADARGQVVLPLSEKLRGSFERPPTWWVTTATHAACFVLPPGDEVLEVRVPQRGRILGKAWLDDGAIAAGREVCLLAGKGLVLRTRTDAGGAFTIEGAPARPDMTVVLLCDPELVSVRTARAEVRPALPTELEIGTPTGATIRGRVTAAGRGLEGAGIMIRSVNSRQALSAFADAQGGFALTGIPAGGWHFTVLLGDPRVSDDFGMQREQPIALSPGALLEQSFDLPGGALRVRMLDAATGVAIAGAQVTGQPEPQVVVDQRFTGFRYAPGCGATTDERGEARLLGLPDGQPHRVDARAPGYANKGVAAIVPGAHDRPVEVVLRLDRKP